MINGFECPECDAWVDLERPVDEVAQEYECKNCGRKSITKTVRSLSLSELIAQINEGKFD